jgi:hypothetical protein
VPSTPAARADLKALSNPGARLDAIQTRPGRFRSLLPAKVWTLYESARLRPLRELRSKGVDLAARLSDMRQKYIPQIYNVRVHRTDGTRRLLLG